MKKLFVSLALLFLTGVAEAGPTLTLSADHHDFGTLLEGDPAKETFTLTNSGDAPLAITRVRTSCGCTASALDKNELAPGESTSLAISYETRHRPGQFSKTVTLFTNDPKTPERVITINGTVKGFPKPLATLTPNPIRVGAQPVGVSREFSFTLGNSGDAPLIVSEIVLLNELRQPLERLLEGEPIRLKPGESKWMKVSITPIRLEPFRFYVKVSTNNPLSPLIYLTLFGEGVSK